MKDLLLIPFEGNPLFPLPHNYFDSSKYSDEDRRFLRVNACRQWLRDDVSPSVLGEVKALCLRFFDEYYLRPDDEDDFDPGFYDDAPLETPAFHYDFVRLTGNPQNRFNIMIAPRGSAKTTLLKKLTLLEMMTRNSFSICYATSSVDNANFFSSTVRLQCYRNQRLSDDFSKDKAFDGRIRPNQSEGSTGVEYFELRNRSWLRAVSARSSIRGIRPRRFRLDDPEYDFRSMHDLDNSIAVGQDFMERLLFTVAGPTTTRRNTGFDWTATLISRRHYASTAVETEERQLANGKIISVAADSRFDHWNRLIVRAAKEETPGVMTSVWPQMWPADDAERKAYKLPETTRTLVEMRRELGEAAFEAEFMGRPGSSGASNFFGALTDEKHGYSFGSPDEFMADQPYKSSTPICWWRDHVEQRMPLHHFCQMSRLAIVSDTSFTAKLTSDYKVATVLALTKDNDLFVLDMWSAKCHESLLVQNIFKLAEKWHVPSVHVEVVKGSQTLKQQLDSVVRQRATDISGTTFMPRIVGFNPGMADKGRKIASLLPRFEIGKIKLPLFKRYQNPWPLLFMQIEGFNPDLRDNGLKHDDHLDTLQMWQMVYMGRPLDQRPTPKRDPVSSHEEALKRLKNGETKDEYGMPLAYHIDMRLLTPDDVQVIRAKTEEMKGKVKSYA